MALYVHGLRFMNARGGRVNELDVIAINDPPHDGWFCWWGSTCNIASSELDTAIRLRGFHRDGPVLHVNQFLILRLRSRTSVQLTPRNVSRALTTTLLSSDGLLIQLPA